MQLVQEAKYTKQKERELNKSKKKKMASLKYMGDQSDEESPASPELLEMSEEYNNNGRDDDSTTNSMDFVKKGTIMKKETNTKKLLNRDTGKKGI